VVAFLGGLAPKAHAAGKEEITRLTLRLLRTVKQEKLSGQVLRNRTGTLRRKVNQRVEVNNLTTTGTVGVKLSYAAAHEFGFQGVVNVRAHLRALKSKDMWAMRRGKKIGETESGIKVYKLRMVKQGSGYTMVRAHSREMKLPERSFLRSALREMEPQIRAGLLAAVKKAVS
jgi:phage gpG-like protein